MSKGLNFAPAPKRIPTKEIVASVESALKRVSQDSASSVRTQMISLLRSAKPPPSNLTPEDLKAISTLKKDQDLMILPADKGRATVLLDREEYDQQIVDMLSDEKTYRKINKDPAPALERRMNALLLGLHRKGTIPKKLYEKLRSSAGQNPLLYGLPKIHKPGVPLRPIVSFVQSPTYQHSKHISDLLSPLVGQSPSAVRNSKEFAVYHFPDTIRR